MRMCPQLPTRILRVYVEALTVFCLVYHPEGLNKLSSLKAVSLKLFPLGE